MIDLMHIEFGRVIEQNKRSVMKTVDELLKTYKTDLIFKK